MTRFSLIVSLALALDGCGGGDSEARVPIAHESPRDEILRVGRVWETAVEEKGFRTPPSPISVFTRRITSSIAFAAGAGAATETLVVDETFKTVDGGTFQCQTKARLRVTALFGEHTDESAVEIGAPPSSGHAYAITPAFPSFVLDLPATASRFVLRGDRLVPFAPATETRAYIPAP